MPYPISHIPYPKYRPKYKTIHDKLVAAHKFEWTSGGIAWFMSNSVAKAFAANIELFMAQVDPFKICYCPDKVTGLMLGTVWYCVVLCGTVWCCVCMCV
jgi:hypothetical protein